mmetsp:Transcript_486/g.599  ORF Transcript_486/g.599 Transcript_486/m.599 type:complete len:98 (+) Transcript_486:176-469(+)
MSHHNDHLVYPNLENCNIVTTSGTAPATAAANGTAVTQPLSLPSSCVEAMNMPLPTLYDFRVENEVMKKKMERDPETKINVDQDQSVEASLSPGKPW